MRIAIVGRGRAGKTTAARWLAEHTPLRYAGSTSYSAARVVCGDPSLSGRYESVDACYADRRNVREEWRRIILDYNGPDGLRLYREMAAENDILDGIRSRRELEACRAAGLAEVVVWIERDVPPDPSLDFGPGAADHLIDNTGALAELHDRLGVLALRLGLEVRA